MSLQKNKGSAKGKKYSQGDGSSMPASSNAPKSLNIRQKRAASWQNNSEDAAAYREYMNEQAEKVGWIEDRQNGLFYFFFIFFMGYAWTLPQIRGSILVFILSSFGAYYTLQLRGGSSLTPRSKGDK